MADKQIIQLSTATSELTGDSWFVFQNSLNSPDFKVKASTIATYIATQGIGSFEVYGGNGNPDPANGASGDLYFQANGSVYKKVGSTWVLKATIGGKIEQVISGTSYTYAYDGRFGNNPTAYTQVRNIDDTGWDIMASQITILDNGNILTLGDYTSGVWRLVIKP